MTLTGPKPKGPRGYLVGLWVRLSNKRCDRFEKLPFEVRGRFTSRVASTVRSGA